MNRMKYLIIMVMGLSLACSNSNKSQIKVENKLDNEKAVVVNNKTTKLTSKEDKKETLATQKEITLYKAVVDQKANEEIQYFLEPKRESIIGDIVPKYVQIRIERAIQESLTSEHASRMTAMESATTNADDVIKKLTLLFNKTRQAMITTELMDIVNGTEAQKQGGND